MLSKKHFCVVQRCLSVLILLLLLASCTTSPITSKPIAFQPSLGSITGVWRINGRISLINETDNWYAKFNWIQQQEDFQISFTGPLGETELQISQINKTILLKTPSGETSSDNLEQLLLQETGWKFPVSSLKYWSQGFPHPDNAARLKYNEQQQISDIFQSGWHIQYPKRMRVKQFSGTDLVLPKKIIATEKNVKIKLIITSWHLEEPSADLFKEPSAGLYKEPSTDLYKKLPTD